MISTDAIIEDAIRRGVLDDLPGEGEPLDLDDDAGVPEDQRLTFRVMKNAGFVPPEVAAFGKIARLREEARACADPEERRRLEVEIRCQEAIQAMRIERMGG